MENVIFNPKDANLIALMLVKSVIYDNGLVNARHSEEELLNQHLFSTLRTELEQQIKVVLSIDEDLFLDEDGEDGLIDQLSCGDAISYIQSIDNDNLRAEITKIYDLIIDVM